MKMKKKMKTFTIVAMAVLMFVASAIPAMAADFDFETAISKFESTALNTIELKVGETHTPTAAVWAQGGAATCHTSDDTVVTVSSQGIVTAVGEGAAYIAIDTGMMYEIYLYNVVSTNEVESDIVLDSRNKNKDSFEKEAEEAYNDFSEKAKEEQEFYVNRAAKMRREHEEAKKKIEKTQKIITRLAVTIIIVSIVLLVAAVVYIFIEAPKCGMSRLWALVPLFSNFIGLLVFIVIRSSRKTMTNTNTIICPTCNGVHPAGTMECSICGTKLQ